MSGYDIAQYTCYSIFLVVCTICYAWEIAMRTPWAKVSRKMRNWLTALGHVFSPDSSSDNAGTVSAGSARTTDSAPTGISHNDVVESTMEQGLQVKPVATQDSTRFENEELARLPLLAWIICLPGWLWPLCAIPAWLQLFENSIPGHAILLTTHVPDWAVNKTIGSEVRLLTDINPDIGGLGIRIGLYIPFGLALLTLVAGLFHKEESAAKEIGSALLLTLFYLNFNTVKAAPIKYQDFTFPEAVLVCISLDLAAASLHMTHSGKETLAARKFVFASVLNQLVGYGNIIAILARIRHNYRGLTCTYLVWWGRIDSCTGPSGPVWVYVVIRGLILVHGLWLDWCYTFSFDDIETDWTELAPGDQDIEKYKGKTSEYLYGPLPGTVFSKWVDWLPAIFIAMSSFEGIVDLLPPDASISDWGQSAALVLAIAGGIHWLYVVWQLGYELWGGASRKRLSLNFPRYESGWDPSNLGTTDRLIKASKAGDIKNIRLALQHNVDVDYVDPSSRMTALLHAVARDNVDLVRELMSKRYGANPAVKETQPALLCAAESGSDRVLGCLVAEKGLTLTDTKHANKDVIWLAAHRGHRTTVKMILNLLPEASQAEAVETALIAAAEANHGDIVRHIVDDYDFTTVDVPYSRALAHAKETFHTNAHALEILLGNNVLVSNVQNCRWPILHQAIQGDEPLATIKALAETYKKVTDTVDLFDYEGRTPLGVAVECGRLYELDMLLSLFADPFARRHGDNNDRSSPFLLAIDKIKYDKRDYRPIEEQRTPVAIMLEGAMDSRRFSNHLFALEAEDLEYLADNFLSLRTTLACSILNKSPGNRTPLLIYALQFPENRPFRLIASGACSEYIGERDSKKYLWRSLRAWASDNKPDGVDWTDRLAKILVQLEMKLSQLPEQDRQKCIANITRITEGSLHKVLTKELADRIWKLLGVNQ